MIISNLCSSLSQCVNLYFFFVEKKIINAAKDVADTLGGDKTKTTSDLLKKVLASRIEALRAEEAETYVNLCNRYKLYLL